MNAFVRRLKDRFGLSHGIALFGAAFMLAVVVALAAQLTELRRTLLDDRLDDARSHALALESHAARSFDAAALTLHRIRDRLELDPAAQHPGDPEFRDALTAMARRLPFAALVMVADAEGRVLHEAPGDAHAGLSL